MSDNIKHEFYGLATCWFADILKLLCSSKTQYINPTPSRVYWYIDFGDIKNKMLNNYWYICSTAYMKTSMKNQISNSEETQYSIKINNRKNEGWAVFINAANQSWDKCWLVSTLTELLMKSAKIQSIDSKIRWFCISKFLHNPP